MTHPRAPGTALALDHRQLAEDAVRSASAQWIAARRARVRPFVDTHFSVRGSLRLHRHAFGPDLLRAPANLALAPLQLGGQLGGRVMRRVRAGRRFAATADRLAEMNLLLDTDVGRAVARAVTVELFELPWADPRDSDGTSTRDSLAEAILCEPAVQAAILGGLTELGRHGDDPDLRERLAALTQTYVGSRTAAAEIANGLMTAGIGLATLKQLTPGALSLGPALAGSIAHKIAVAGFPLGSGLGAVWYGLFPASAPAMLLAASTAGVMAGAVTLAAFSGILADPIQRKLGLHQRRLNRLIDAVEASLLGEAAQPLVLRDHYVARLFDLLDLIVAARRLAGQA